MKIMPIKPRHRLVKRRSTGAALYLKSIHLDFAVRREDDHYNMLARKR
jgi:hypothetical protein